MIDWSVTIIIALPHPYQPRVATSDSSREKFPGCDDRQRT
jgi:hypothetical protein